MKRIKIVQKYFTELEARKAAAYQRQHAKKKNVLVSKVEILSAYNLFKANGWFKCNPFKKLGLPAPEQYMVIVHYGVGPATSKQAANLKNRIVHAVRKKEVGKRFFVVKLSKYQLKRVTYISVIEKKPMLSWKYIKSNYSGRCITLNCSLNARFVAA